MLVFSTATTRLRSNDREVSRRRSADIPHGLRERRDHASRERLLRQVRQEFDELRTLNLTLAQAERLFDLRHDVALRVMDTLIREGLLRRTPDDTYVRRIDRR